MKATQLDGRSLMMGGERYLSFYGTSYLGLPYDKQFQDYVHEGMSLYGSSLGSSPLSIPQLDIYERLEKQFANYYGFEDALLFASGYAAGQTVVAMFENLDYKIAYGNIAHPALKLEKKIIQRNSSENTRRTLHAIDYIDPITFENGVVGGDEKGKDVILIDTSHAFGLFDEELKAFSKQKNVMICGSLNKAMGTNAGVVLGNEAQVRNLKATNRYKTASAPSPAECFALFKAIEDKLINDKKKDLGRLVEGLVTNEFIRIKEGFPVFTFRDSGQKLYDHIKENKALIWRNRYPSEESALVNRAVITAAHSRGDVDFLIQTCKACPV